MDQRSLTQLLIVCGALVVAGAFCIVFLPHTQAYQTYRLERQLKRTLQTFRPPPGDSVLLIRAEYIQGHARGMAVYSTALPFDKVKSHYQGELPGLGFFKTHERTAQGQMSVHFCGAAYAAELAPARGDPPPPLYSIVVHERDEWC